MGCQFQLVQVCLEKNMIFFSLWLSLYLHVYRYIYIYRICIFTVYMYKYIHIKKENERERERSRPKKKYSTVIYHKFITILVESEPFLPFPTARSCSQQHPSQGTRLARPSACPALPEGHSIGGVHLAFTGATELYLGYIQLSHIYIYIQLSHIYIYIYIYIY